MSIKRKKLILVVGTVMLLVALACTCADTPNLGTTEEPVATEEPVVSAEPFETAESNLENSFGIVVTDFHLYQDDGSGSPGEEVDFFSPSDQTMHFEINTEGLPDGETTTWVFTAVETTEGNDIEVARVETEAIEEADQLTSTLTLPNDWPVGTYLAEVFVGDELIYTIEYEVVE